MASKLVTISQAVIGQAQCDGEGPAIRVHQFQPELTGPVLDIRALSGQQFIRIRDHLPFGPATHLQALCEISRFQPDAHG